MRLFVGLDVSLAKTAICVISEHGKIVKEAQVASEAEELVRWAREQDGTIAAIGLEAGPLSQWLHRGLSIAGLDVILMETRQVKGARKAPYFRLGRSRRTGGMPRALRACFTLAGSGPFTANPSRRKRSVPCSGPERPSSRV
jgi:transposase